MLHEVAHNYCPEYDRHFYVFWNTLREEYEVSHDLIGASEIDRGHLVLQKQTSVSAPLPKQNSYSRGAVSHHRPLPEQVTSLRRPSHLLLHHNLQFPQSAPYSPVARHHAAA